MQIHELTKLLQQTNEGLLDNIKAGITAAKTVGSAAYQGAKAVGQAVTSPTFGAVTSNQAKIDSANKNIDAINKKYGLNIQKPTRTATQLKAGPAAGVGPDIAKAAQDLTATFQSTELFKDIVNTTSSGEALNDTTPPPVTAGHRLVMPSTATGYPSNYYLDSNGAWTSEEGKRLTDQSTIAKLNSLANGGAPGVKEVPDPKAQQAQQGKGGATALNKAATAAAATQPGFQQPPIPPHDPVPEPGSPELAAWKAAKAKQGIQEVASNARKAQRLATGKTKPAAQPAQAPAAQAPAAPAQPAVQAPAQPAQQPAGDIATKINNDPKLKPLFDKFGKEFGVSLAEVKDRPEVVQALASLNKVINAPMKAGKDQRIAKAFQSYATVVLTAMKAVGTGEDTDGDGIPDNQAASQVQQSATPIQKSMAAQSLTQAGLPGPAIVKAAATNPKVKKDLATVAAESRKPLTQRLEEAIRMLKEDQVRITKDIVVPTNAGDYVKKASDQQWYAPNGVMIDPEKYADYIKKLDATPQAQTRYQADSVSGGGSDTAFKKSHQAAQPPQQPPTPPAPPPQAAAPAGDNPVNDYVAQQQMLASLRADQVRNHNAMVADTVNQLRNAEIFGTGQKDYLQQRLVQLIATKF